MVRFVGSYGLGALLLAGIFFSPDDASGGEPSVETSDYWKVRSDSELQSELKSLCEKSVADGRPILLAFSAPWCGDCRAVQAYEKRQKLSDELQNWHHLVVEVGRFDRHPDLLRAFGVQKIAHWVALRPSDCKTTASEWTRLSESVFEPKSGSSVDEKGLADWLINARQRSAPVE